MSLPKIELLATAVLVTDEAGTPVWRMCTTEDSDDYQCLKLPAEAFPPGTQIVIKRQT